MRTKSNAHPKTTREIIAKNIIIRPAPSTTNGARTNHHGQVGMSPYNFITASISDTACIAIKNILR